MTRRSLWRDERGASAVEFAFVAPCLCLLLFASIEVGTLGMVSSALDNAVLRTARAIRTGQSDGPTSADTFKDMVCGYMGGSASECRSKLVVSIQRLASFSSADAVAATPPAGEFDKGVAGDIILVRANYRWTLITPTLARFYSQSGPSEVTLDSRAAFRNEPYS